MVRPAKLLQSRGSAAVLGDALGDAFGDALGEALGEALGDALGDALGEELGEALGDAQEHRQRRRFAALVLVQSNLSAVRSCCLPVHAPELML